MFPHSGDPDRAERGWDSLVRDAALEYRRLVSALALRARWLGSRDGESAAQEALKRSLENPQSQYAVEYYFGQDSPCAAEPEWALDQLLAWLHGVVRHVVQEEQHRASYRREVQLGSDVSEEHWAEPADSAPGQLDLLIRKELESIVVDCMPGLDREYRTVLKMRANGLKYGEIATRMGVNENTVATWVSRGIRTLARKVRNHAGRAGRELG
jgi:RNA polymerase sigma factor (sigma-70 family)